MSEFVEIAIFWPLFWSVVLLMLWHSLFEEGLK